MDISALNHLPLQFAVLLMLLLNNYETVAYLDETHNVDVCAGKRRRSTVIKLIKSCDSFVMSSGAEIMTD
jgi:hypothetical protein